ncbi:MAG: class I SAM-dependent methyltransferase [Chloroflexi bacterium]|nr:class I SAM-dependent methyltransferase [Chloroflexota bacterium]
MTLFEGTAWYYARYRPGHSPDLAPAFAELFQLDGGGQLLDLGTGTGAIALALANHFDAVAAVDPDASMLSEAARAARGRGLANVQFIHARAEELGDSLGKFRLITVGSAFHWMDRDQVLNIAHRALVPSGVFAIIESPGKATDTSGSALPPVPWDRVHAVVSRYLGPKRRAGRGFYAAPDESYQDMMDRSLFGGHHTLTLPGVPATRSVEDVIGYLFSTSYASRQLFGDRVAAFEDRLRRELLEASPSGEFFEPARPTEVIYSQRN